LSAAVVKVRFTAGGVLTPRSSHPALPLSVGLEDTSIGLICRSELCREQSPLAALDIFFDGLLVDIANWLELLREHQQGRIQVDEAPGLMRAGLRRDHSDPWLALNVTRAAFLEGPDNRDACLLSLRARRHVPGDTPTLCLKIRVR
jgi:hypothetical protein